MRDCFINGTRTNQAAAEQIMSLPMSRIVFERQPVMPLSLLIAAGVVQQQSQLGVRISVVRVEFHRLSKGLGGFGSSSLLDQEQPPVVIGFYPAGIQFDRCSKVPLGPLGQA